MNFADWINFARGKTRGRRGKVRSSIFSEPPTIKQPDKNSQGPEKLQTLKNQ